MDGLNVVAGWLNDKFLYIIGLAIVVLASIEICGTYREKHWIKFVFLIIVFIPLVMVPAYNTVNYITVRTEEFSTMKGNIRYLSGETGNIIFETQKNIEEPVNLRIKDRWINLVYLTDYAVKNNKEVMINYEFGNNDTDNKKVADIGLVFTYKARRK